MILSIQVADLRKHVSIFRLSLLVFCFCWFKTEICSTNRRLAMLGVCIRHNVQKAMPIGVCLMRVGACANAPPKKCKYGPDKVERLMNRSIIYKILSRVHVRVRVRASASTNLICIYCKMIIIICKKNMTN